MADARTIVAETDGPLAVIRLNRPEALNAITFPMLAELRSAILAAEADPRVIAIAITGEGRGFCAGLDMSTLVNQVDGAKTGARKTEANKDSAEPPALFSYLLSVTKPMIAAVNGVAAGGGFVLTMMCDLRFVSESAYFTTVFSKRGLIAEHGMSWLLPRQLGASRALDLLWSSRKVPADEALRIGLADRVVPDGELLSTVRAYAADLAANISPRSIAVIKSQVYRHLSEGFRPAVDDTDKLMTDALLHPDAKEGAQSFIERRPPQFASWSGGKA